MDGAEGDAVDALGALFLDPDALLGYGCLPRGRLGGNGGHCGGNGLVGPARRAEPLRLGDRHDIQVCRGNPKASVHVY